MGTVYLRSWVRYTYSRRYGIPTVVGTVYPWDKLFGLLLIKKGQGWASERRAFLAESTEGATGEAVYSYGSAHLLNSEPM